MGDGQDLKENRGGGEAGMKHDAEVMRQVLWVLGFGESGEKSCNLRSLTGRSCYIKLCGLENTGAPPSWWWE